MVIKEDAISLREYLEAQIAAEARRFDTLRAADRELLAVSISCVVKVGNEMTTCAKELDKRLDDVNERLVKMETSVIARRTGLKDYLGYILFALSVAGSIVGFVMMR